MSETRFKLRDADLDWREVEGELVALDLRESRYLSVNRSGRILWGALAAGATREELVARLVEEFEIEPEKAATDVDAFTEELEGRGLLEREPSGASDG